MMKATEMVIEYLKDVLQDEGQSAMVRLFENCHHTIQAEILEHYEIGNGTLALLAERLSSDILGLFTL